MNMIGSGLDELASFLQFLTCGKAASSTAQLRGDSRRSIDGNAREACLQGQSVARAH